MPVFHRIDAEYLPVFAIAPRLDLTDIAAARLALHKIFALGGAVESDPGVERSDIVAPGLAGNPEIAMRMHRPSGATGPLPCLFWIQGGGYVLTSLDPDDRLCQSIARELHCVVISVVWRRAPEHPFPACHDDCYGGLRWVIQNAKALGVDPAHVVVGGASSGGGAAAGVALRVRDEGEFSIAHQLLIYPMLDDRNETRSSHNVTDPELWNRQGNEIAWAAYLGGAASGGVVSHYAAPARAVALEGLAPTTILTAELDLFVDENIDYAKRLMAAGVPVELHIYPAVHHGFDVHNPEATISKRFFADRNAVLRRAFASPVTTGAGL
jgi:acetyl esterase/lipase